jgi:hypothetical protein
MNEFNPRFWKAGEGRWVAAAMVVGYFCALTLLAMVWGCDIGVVWNEVGVPALPQHFADLRDIATGIERFERADQPWSPETIAYSVQAFSYPKWWLGAAFLGLNLDTFYFFGFLISSLYFACSFYVLGGINKVEGFMAGLLLVSPAVMTGVERGNGDLVIFLLLTFVLSRRRSLPWATGGIFLAAILKLYPAAALLALARPPWRRALPWLAGALALFGMDLLTSGQEIPQIARGILHMQYFSFGSTPILIGLIWLYPTVFDYTEILAMGTLGYLAVLAVAIWARPRVRLRPEWEREIVAFRIGASIYIGTFALGTNYDYRFTILVFCLPLLFLLRKDRGIGHLCAGVAAFSIIVYSDWYFVFADTYGTGLQFFAKQLIGWTILGCLAALLAGTFPGVPVAEKDERLEPEKAGSPAPLKEQSL